MLDSFEQVCHNSAYTITAESARFSERRMFLKTINLEQIALVWYQDQAWLLASIREETARSNESVNVSTREREIGHNSDYIPISRIVVATSQMVASVHRHARLQNRMSSSVCYVRIPAMFTILPDAGICKLIASPREFAEV